MSIPASRAGVLPGVLRRHRLVVAIGLAVLTVLAWAYIVQMSRMMSPHLRMSMPMEGGSPELSWLVPMWIVMMVAMMVPSATPTILLFTTVAARRRAQGVPTASAAVFTLGYLLVWSFYATTAAALQGVLHRAALVSPSMVSASPWLGGALLIGAGVYQWLPVKNACLSQCRSPLGYLSSEWREGSLGALIMGVRHGTYCVGCCGLLMALLFVAGVMNLLWVAAIAIFVLAEKLAPAGPRLGRLTGLLLIGWGVGVMVASVQLLR